MQSRSAESPGTEWPGQSPEIRTVTARDGATLRLRRWQPDNARGHVVLLHGIISHSGWYLKTGSQLARAGFAVHSLDRRGSGLNLASRGDVDHYETWIADVRDYLAQLPNNAPRILLGISWGGLLATAVARRPSTPITGLGLLCPGFFSRKGTSRLQHAAVRLAASAGLGGLRFPVPLRDPALFTDSPPWQRYIRDDPFTLRTVTLRLATASADLYAATIHPSSHPAKPLETPTLLCLGGRDAILQNAAVRKFASRHFSPALQIQVYAEAAHTLEFEPDPSDYFRDLIAWCEHCCAAAPSLMRPCRVDDGLSADGSFL